MWKIVSRPNTKAHWHVSKMPLKRSTLQWWSSRAIARGAIVSYMIATAILLNVFLITFSLLFCWLGEVMMARARNFGTELQMEQAKSLKLTSCENLARIGLTKFMTNWNQKKKTIPKSMVTQTHTYGVTEHSEQNTQTVYNAVHAKYVILSSNILQNYQISVLIHCDVNFTSVFSIHFLFCLLFRF